MKPIAIAAAVMFMAVALGAFGAHALQARLAELGRTHAWETAVLYHLVHGLALLALGVWRTSARPVDASRMIRLAGGLWLAGIAFFCGSLYLLGVGGPRWLGPITPLGGTAFLAGWVCLAVGVLHIGRKAPPA